MRSSDVPERTAEVGNAREHAERLQVGHCRLAKRQADGWHTGRPPAERASVLERARVIVVLPMNYLGGNAEVTGNPAN